MVCGLIGLLLRLGYGGRWDCVMICRKIEMCFFLFFCYNVDVD